MIRTVVALYCGYVTVRAACRWGATIRIIGIRRALAGARMMWDIRLNRLRSRAYGRPLLHWPIPPTVPIVFELQVAVLLYVVFVTGRKLADVIALFQDPVMVPLMILAAVHASEDVVPPCILYLGVSEPGHFDSLRFLLTSYNWLTVSGMDQDNPEVSLGDAANRGVFALIWSVLIRNIPGAVLIERRRLESIRTGDDTWEVSVRRVLDFVPLIIVDLRTWSSMVSTEFCWVLDSGSSGRLIVVTRDDGTTVIDAVLSAAAVDLPSACRLAISGPQLAGVVRDLVPTKLRIPDARAHKRNRTEGDAARLSGALKAETDVKQVLLEELATTKGHSAELDRKLWRWAVGKEEQESVAKLTEAISAAVTLVKRRIPVFSYSVNVAAGRTGWTDIGVQIIPNSFRVSHSWRRETDNAAKALLMSLLRAELGIAQPQSGRSRSHIRLHPGLSRLSVARAEELANDPLKMLLDDLRNCKGGRDPLLERRLARWLGIAIRSETGQPRENILEDLDAAIAAAESLFKSNYSMTIHVSVDGLAEAEVAMRAERRWLVAFSYDPPRLNYMRPPQALLAAALKAELCLFEGVSGV